MIDAEYIKLAGDPFADYLAHPGIGSHLAMTMLESPRLFRDRQTGLVPFEDRPCLELGRIVHMAVLEPARYAAQVKGTGPINEKTGRPYGRDTAAWREWEQANPGVIVPEPWLPLAIERMPAEVRAALRGTVREGSIYAQHEGIDVKCRADAYAPGVFRDLKTIGDTRGGLDRAIDRAMQSHHYWFQAGWYATVHQLAFSGVAPEFEFIFMETEPPYRWRIVPMEPDAMAYALDKAEQVMAEIARRTDEDDWTDDAPVRRPWLMPEWMLADPTITADGGISL